MELLFVVEVICFITCVLRERTGMNKNPITSFLHIKKKMWSDMTNESAKKSLSFEWSQNSRDQKQ